MKNERGITLIALVITIIILIILAAVSIGMLTGNNGIASNAKTADTQTKEKSIAGKIDMELAAFKADLEVEGYVLKTTVDSANSVLGITIDVTGLTEKKASEAEDAAVIGYEIPADGSISITLDGLTGSINSDKEVTPAAKASQTTPSETPSESEGTT